MPSSANSFRASGDECADRPDRYSTDAVAAHVAGSSGIPGKNLRASGFGVVCVWMNSVRCGAVCARRKLKRECRCGCIRGLLVDADKRWNCWCCGGDCNSSSNAGRWWWRGVLFDVCRSEEAGQKKDIVALGETTWRGTPRPEIVRRRAVVGIRDMLCFQGYDVSGVVAIDGRDWT